MKKPAPRLTSVTALPERVLHATYTDGREIHVAMTDTVDRFPAFAALADPREFNAVAVVDFGWSVEWPCGASLDSDRLLELAMEQSGREGNVAFRHWQDAHHLSLAEAALALGMTRRTISQYRSGTRPVPRYIALACRGWEAEQRAA